MPSTTSVFAIDPAVTVGRPSRTGDLWVYPVTSAPSPTPATASANAAAGPAPAAGERPRYQTLTRALQAGTLIATELPGEAAVPLVHLENLGELPVLVLDGEQLVGAKQNRVANLTVLVPARSALDLPVVCAEAGRWAPGQSGFARTGQIHFSSGRARKMADVSDCLRATGQPQANQHDVWDAIEEKVMSFDAAAPTRAMEDVFEAAAERLDALVSRVEPVEGQRGAVFAVRRRILGFELFDDPGTFSDNHAKLVRSFGIDVIDPSCRHGVVADPERIPDTVRALDWQRVPTIGLGTMWRAEGGGYVGGALTLDSRLVHLSLLARA